MIDKSSWKSYKFEDIVTNIKEKAKPNACDEIPYIGLEHLQSESFEIPLYGTSNDITGEKFLIKKGDVLFGKRRAYQRKVGIAPFGGIFSAHGMVLRSKPNIIIKELLPFFIRSDIFMNRAISMSVGSLSPTVNWSELKNETFNLPPIEEQEHIAELLWAAEENFEKQKELSSSLAEAHLALINELLFSSNGKKKLLSELARFNEKTIKSKEFAPEQIIKYIDIGCIIRPKILGEAKTFAFSEAPSRARRIAKVGDILISTVRPNLKSFCRIDDGEYVVSTGFAVATPQDIDCSEILFHVIFSNRFVDYCNNKATGTNYPAINVGDIEDFKIYLNKKYSISSISGKLRLFQQAMDNNDTNLNNARAVKKDLLSLYFGGAN